LRGADESHKLQSKDESVCGRKTLSDIQQKLLFT